MTPADLAHAAIEQVDNTLASGVFSIDTFADLGAALRLLAQAVIAIAPARGTVAPLTEVNPGTRTTARLEPLTDEPAIGPQSNISDVPHEVLLDAQWESTRARGEQGMESLRGRPLDERLRIVTEKAAAIANLASGHTKRDPYVRQVIVRDLELLAIEARALLK